MFTIGALERFGQSLLLTPDDILAAEREMCQRSFAYFVQRAWHVVEPATKLKWGWALDAICAHLEAVSSGEIQNLLANVPPGSMKSLLVGVFWPAWEWGPCNKPYLRYIGTAHEENLAIRDRRRCRDLLKSDWYQARWPIQFRLDMDGKKEFGNTKTGFMNARAFGSMTGARGDRVLLDDPISAKNANSQAHLQEAETTFLETLPTRINDEETSSIVVIMQRLHERDVSGIILEKGLPYVHLCLPMECDGGRRFYTPIKPRWYDAKPISAKYDVKTQRWYAPGDEVKEQDQERVDALPAETVYDPDPRHQVGELMFPERFSEKGVKKLKLNLGTYATAGQLQQRPAPRGGGIIREAWWGWWQVMPRIAWRLMFVDTAQKEGEENDYSVLQDWGMCEDGRIALLDQMRGKWEAPDLDRNARQFWNKRRSLEDIGPLNQMYVEDKVSGTGLIQALKRPTPMPDGSVMPAIPVKAIQRNRDKVSRAYSAGPQIEAGNVLLPMNATWITDYIAEFNSFPAGAHDDQCDPTFDAIEKMLGGIVRTPTVVENEIPESIGPSVVEG